MAGANDGALFYDHALWAESHAGRAEQQRSERDRFQRALWDKAFAPTILSLGYDPVRAD
jgi:hypothetical protein